WTPRWRGASALRARGRVPRVCLHASGRGLNPAIGGIAGECACAALALAVGVDDGLQAPGFSGTARFVQEPLLALCVGLLEGDAGVDGGFGLPYPGTVFGACSSMLVFFGLFPGSFGGLRLGLLLF